MQAMQHNYPTRDTRRIPSRRHSSRDVVVIVLVLHSSSLVMISGRAFARSSVKCVAADAAASSAITRIRIADSASARNWASFLVTTHVAASSPIASPVAAASHPVLPRCLFLVLFLRSVFTAFA
ncbi:hypothetical protein ON010_g15116 [Phytophthora cinnamomi]|nr:hypothetical protein ON010_g15116 [Phytophthora cinnamomi]